MYFIDLDDFHEHNTQLPMLERAKREVPGLRVTLFTVPGLCSDAFLRAVRHEYEWIDLVPHGWTHMHSRECQAWDTPRCEEYLRRIEGIGEFTHGFKAPGWQISDAMYYVLLDHGWWVADQEYNNHRRPVNLRRYLLDAPNKIHGHIGHMGGHNANELELILPQILALRGEEFGFVRDAV